MTIVSSPGDPSKGDFGTRVNFIRLTQADPAAYVERVARTAQSGAQPEDVVNVSEINVSGTAATRIDSTVASPLGPSLSIKFLVLLNDGVLQAEVTGQEAQVRPLLGQVNEILDSLQVK